MYRLLDAYGQHLVKWHEKMRKILQPHIPAIVKVIEVFHRKNPVIIGVEVVAGVLKKNEPLALPNGTLGGKMIGYVDDI